MDLDPLELFGQGLAKGYPAPPRALKHLQTLYTVEQLIKIAETDGISPDVLRAVTVLLEVAA